MATPPDFTVGQVLTAAQMNAIGLWRITTCTVSSVGGTAATASNGVITVGTGNTSVTVSNAFSADYDNYRITYSGGTQSASTDIALKLGTSATGYNGYLIYGDSIGGGVVGAGTNNNTVMPWIGGGNAGQASHVLIDLIGPYLTAYTKFRNGSYQNGTLYGTLQGEHRVSASYTGFTLSVALGTLTGGQIRVYGYRN